MRVRPAVRHDLVPVRRVADAAHWETYAGLLKPDTIGRLLTRDFSPAALRRRLLGGGMLVVDRSEVVVAFVDFLVGTSDTAIHAIATEPKSRRHGAARALVEAVRGTRPTHPIRADVLLGNLDGERFYEACGFAPGEVLHGTLFGEDVVERRWWLAPG
jgi:GNAT superfamily N-acetyltransferase